MTEYLVSVTFSHVSGFPEDNVVNGFVVDAFPGWDPMTELLEVSAPIMSFFHTDNAGGDNVANYLSPELSRAAGAVELAYYDISDHLDGSPHGSPVVVDHSTLQAPWPGSAGMPAEVALAATLRAHNYDLEPIEQPDADVPPDGKVDRPRQRYTGKLYVGPFVVAANSADGSNRSRPGAGLMQAIAAGSLALQAGLGVNGHNWSVWSRKDAVVRSIDYVQVDDAWDTQRRRGIAPSVRTTTTIP